MAGEELKTVQQLLADYGDNTSGNIDAVNVRNHLVSATPAIGYLADSTPGFTIGVDGPWGSVNGDITPAPESLGNFWITDGNNEFIEGYTPLGVTIPAGTTRLVGMECFLEVEHQGSPGDDFYDFQFFQGGSGGTPAGRTFGSVAIGNSPQFLVFSTDTLWDVSLNQPIGLYVRSENGVPGSADLTCLDIQLRVTGVLL